MPSIGTQTSSQEGESFYLHKAKPPLTPPATPKPSPASSDAGIESPAPSTSSLPGVHIRRRAKLRGKSMPFNLYVDGINITMPAMPPAESAKKPEMKSQGTQAGEPQLRKARAGKWMRRWIKFCDCVWPIVRILLIVPMFFIDRVGFGVSLNGLFDPGKK